MKVTMLNTAEGARIITDANGRPHSFPCGAIADIDLPDAHAKMFMNVTTRSTMMILPDRELDQNFILMLELVRDMATLTYNEALQRARIVFGINGLRQRPSLAEVRVKVQRIATAYAMAGFTNFDQIMKLESSRDASADDRVSDGTMTQDAMRTMAQNVRLNVPRHVQAQMAQRAEFADIITEEPSDDVRARTRQVLGRVPTALPLHQTMNSNEMPSATPGEFGEDTRSPEEIAADIERSGDFYNENDTSLAPPADDDDAPTLRTEPRKRPAKAPSGTKQGQRRQALAKKAVKKKVKAGSRR